MLYILLLCLQFPMNLGKAMEMLESISRLLLACRWNKLIQTHSIVWHNLRSGVYHFKQIDRLSSFYILLEVGRNYIFSCYAYSSFCKGFLCLLLSINLGETTQMLYSSLTNYCQHASGANEFRPIKSCVKFWIV